MKTMKTIGLCFLAHLITMSSLYASEPLGVIRNHRAPHVFCATSDGGFAFVTAIRGSLQLTKCNCKSEVEWQETLADSCYYTVFGMLQCRDSGFLIYGSDAFALRTTSQGQTIWRKDFGGSKQNEFRSALATSDEQFLLFGFTHSFDAVGYDYYLVKIDRDGLLLWQNIYCGMDQSEPICGVNGKYANQAREKKDEHNYGISILEDDGGDYLLIGDIDKGVNILTINSSGEIISSKLYDSLRLHNAFRCSDGSVIAWGESTFLELKSITRPHDTFKFAKKNKLLCYRFEMRWVSMPNPKSGTAIMKIDDEGVCQWSCRWNGYPRSLIEYTNTDDFSYLLINNCEGLTAVSLTDGRQLGQDRQTAHTKRKLINTEAKTIGFEYSDVPDMYPLVDITINEVINPVVLSDSLNQLPTLLPPGHPELAWAPDSVLHEYLLSELARTIRGSSCRYNIVTEFSFILPRPADISLTLWHDNVLVETLVNGPLLPGGYYVGWQPYSVEHVGQLEIRFADERGNNYCEPLLVKLLHD